MGVAFRAVCGICKQSFRLSQWADHIAASRHDWFVCILLSSRWTQQLNLPCMQDQWQRPSATVVRTHMRKFRRISGDSGTKLDQSLS